MLYMSCVLPRSVQSECEGQSSSDNQLRCTFWRIDILLLMGAAPSTISLVVFEFGFGFVLVEDLTEEQECDCK